VVFSAMGGRCGLEAKTASVDTATASFDAPKEIPKSVAPNEAPKDTTRLVIDESNVNKDANKANELTPVQQLAAARQRSTTSGSRSTNYSTLDTRASSDRSYKVVIKALDEDDPLFAVSQEATKELDFDDDTHTILGKVCDFVCGAESPPAPEPVTFMERGLADIMRQFQSQMANEVKAGGGEPDEEYMQKPELAAMWELERFFPSSEDADLRVVDLRFLAICRETGNAALITMNIFCLGDFSSGFTLDRVKKVPQKYITQQLVDLAQERFYTRRMGIPMGTDLFEGDYDGRTPIHIAASDGEIEAASFLVKVAEGDNDKISPRDRWGGTPLGDSERGLRKDPTSENFAACVKLFQEANADPDVRGDFPTIDVPLNESPQAVEIIEAAAGGNIRDMRKFGGNPDLFCCDYDSRTAMHLAASEGHLEIIKFLLEKMEHSEVIRTAKGSITKRQIDTLKDLSEEADSALKKAEEEAMATADSDGAAAAEEAAADARKAAEEAAAALQKLTDESVRQTRLAQIIAKLEIVNPLDRFYATPIMDCIRESRDESLKELTKWNDELIAEIKTMDGGAECYDEWLTKRMEVFNSYVPPSALPPAKAQEEPAEEETIAPAAPENSEEVAPAAEEAPSAADASEAEPPAAETAASAADASETEPPAAETAASAADASEAEPPAAETAAAAAAAEEAPAADEAAG